MNQLETGEMPAAAHAASDLQDELAEVLRQRAAISAVLRAIASSPHDLQPIFDTILDSARRLSRADTGVFRLVEEAGFRLVARALSPAVSEKVLPPTLVKPGTFHGNFYDRLLASKSPLHVHDVALELHYAGEARAVIERGGLRTLLFVPMLRKHELIGSLTLGRLRVEPFTEKEIELVTDFAAQATIALEIVRRERQQGQLQAELAHANRVATLGQLAASITHEVKQPIAVAVTGAQAAQRWLNMQPANLAEVSDALLRIATEGKRAGDIIDRIRNLIKKAPSRKEAVDINEAIGEVLGLTRGEAVKNGVSVQTDLAWDLPLVEGDRVQLQQVMLNLIVNGIQAMSGVAEGPRDLLISTEAAEHGVRVGVLDTGPGLHPENLPRLFEPFYTTKPDGIGMGLSICRSIIEAHGGQLWATGHTPQGALFQFTIPARPA
ncbi:ATP-binding protein [Bradyrhizobium sp. NP1]|uniref:ATP-binding protein n=1 Tax=Bradyrhizobium sp. NP1 TaxID=3049772 RepID=UPI0033911E32